VRRLLRVLLISGALVAALGLWQYFFGSLEIRFVDMSLFSDLGGRVYATFENPNMLAEYLALLVPLFLAVSLYSGKAMQRFGSTCGFLLGLACLIFTWSRGAWLGTIVAVLTFLLLLSHHTLSYLLLCALPGAAVLPMLPERIVRRFASIGSGVDSSIRYRRHLWEGVRNMLNDHWLTGVGVGENAFCTVYERYALPGIETAVHSHNVYLQLLCGLGIVGLVVFAVALLLWGRRALEYYRYGELRTPRLVVLGGLCGILALLVMGLFDDIFYNYRIFFLFWTVMGLVVAQLRIGEETSERAYNPVDDERTQGEIVFRFH
jgi:O-antigen ligase